MNIATNQTHQSRKLQEDSQSSLVWETDMEEFHLASVDYGKDTGHVIQGHMVGCLDALCIVKLRQCMQPTPCSPKLLGS